MAWVVKELRTEGFEALRRDAERDARRRRRGADRVCAQVAAELDDLARMADALLVAVQRQRMAACPPAPRPPGAEPVADVYPLPPPPEAAPVPRRPARRDGRASLHSSPLLELFRATG